MLKRIVNKAGLWVRENKQLVATLIVGVLIGRMIGKRPMFNVYVKELSR